MGEEGGLGGVDRASVIDATSPFDGYGHPKMRRGYLLVLD